MLMRNGRLASLRTAFDQETHTLAITAEGHEAISGDLRTPEGRAAGVINFPNVMSKFLMLGMPLDQVIACATSNASRAFPVFHNRGTLKPGAPADIAVLELREGNFEFDDNFKNTRTGKQRLFPSATVLAGKRVAT